MSGRVVSSATFRQRPWYVHALNRMLPRVSLDKDRLIALARKRSGLRDFGSGYWEEPLDILLRAVREEADLHPLGRFMMREQLVGRLIVRLQAEAFFKKHPEILEQELLPVWLIAGLQRTGTTKLQRLLGADPDNRSLYSWESMFPAPLHSDWQKREKRIPRTRTAEKAMRFLAPDFFAIHPVEHLQPEEDVLLLDVTFMSTSAEAMMHVPGYAAWLEEADQSPAYEYEARLLKLLQWQRPGKRWILKSPHHLEWLEVVCRVYPQVHVIWPHRPVHQCVPSFMSMVAHGRSIFSQRVDAATVGRHWLRKNARMLERALAFRQAHPDQPITDIFYPVFVTDAVGELQRLYREAGLPFPQPLRRRFADAESRSDPQRYGRHEYRLADFGLKPADVDAQTQAYQRFLQRIQTQTYG